MLKQRNKIEEILKQNFLLFLLIAIFVVQSIITPKFLSIESILNVMLHASYIGIIAIGMTLVILVGGIDLSVGSTLALSGCFFAGFQVFSGLPIGISFIFAILLAIIAGVIIGVMISYLHMVPFIVTLAGMYVIRGIVLVYTKQVPISGLSPRISFWGVGSIGRIPISIIIWLLIAILIHFLLKHTIFGETLYAIGQNEQVAKLSGLNVNLSKLIVYTISALLAALVGILLTARLDSAQPTMGQGWEFDAIACTVLGGTSLRGGVANIGKVILGTIVITIIRTGLNMMGMSADFQQVITGLIIITVVGIESFSIDR